MEPQQSNKISDFESIDPTLCINSRVRRLHRTIDGIYQSRLKSFGLKGSMLSILFVIGKNEGINQKALSDYLVIDQSTVSRDLRKLDARNWILSRKGGDLRQRRWELTAEGLALLNEVAPVWHEIHLEMERLLGSYNIQQIDLIMRSVQSFAR